MKYFIDCGTHLFEGLNYFHNEYEFNDTWCLYSFEANPITYELSLEKIPQQLKNILIHKNLAVYNKNDKIIVNCDSDSQEKAIGQGSNILQNPPDADKCNGKKFCYTKKEIECFDLSEFILNLKDIELLIIKMDIEGAEFEVLEKIINDRSFQKINKMYIEFHERFFLNEIQYVEKKINYLNFLRNNNVDAIEWH